LKCCLRAGVKQDHGRFFVHAKTVVNSHLPFGPTRTLLVVVPLYITQGIAYLCPGQFTFNGIFVSIRHDIRYAVSDSRNGAQRPCPFSANWSPPRRARSMSTKHGCTWWKLKIPRSSVFVI
jgi:hypothetical protein